MLTLRYNILSTAYYTSITINTPLTIDWFTKTNNLTEDIRYWTTAKTIPAETGVFNKKNGKNFISGWIKFLTSEKHVIEKKIADHAIL